MSQQIKDRTKENFALNDKIAKQMIEHPENQKRYIDLYLDRYRHVMRFLFDTKNSDHQIPPVSDMFAFSSGIFVLAGIALGTGYLILSLPEMIEKLIVKSGHDVLGKYISLRFQEQDILLEKQLNNAPVKVKSWLRRSKMFTARWWEVNKMNIQLFRQPGRIERQIYIMNFLKTNVQAAWNRMATSLKGLITRDVLKPQDVEPFFRQWQRQWMLWYYTRLVNRYKQILLKASILSNKGLPKGEQSETGQKWLADATNITLLIDKFNRMEETIKKMNLLPRTRFWIKKYKPRLQSYFDRNNFGISSAMGHMNMDQNDPTYITEQIPDAIPTLSQWALSVDELTVFFTQAKHFLDEANLEKVKIQHLPYDHKDQLEEKHESKSTVWSTLTSYAAPLFRSTWTANIPASPPPPPSSSEKTSGVSRLDSRSDFETSSPSSEKTSPSSFSKLQVIAKDIFDRCLKPVLDRYSNVSSLIILAQLHDWETLGCEWDNEVEGKEISIFETKLSEQREAMEQQNLNERVLFHDKTKNTDQRSDIIAQHLYQIDADEKEMTDVFFMQLKRKVDPEKTKYILEWIKRVQQVIFECARCYHFMNMLIEGMSQLSSRRGGNNNNNDDDDNNDQSSRSKNIGFIHFCLKETMNAVQKIKEMDRQFLYQHKPIYLILNPDITDIMMTDIWKQLKPLQVPKSTPVLDPASSKDITNLH